MGSVKDRILWIKRGRKMTIRTTFSITSKLLDMENKILKETGLSRAAYHRKAVQKYLDQEHPGINPRLLIRQKSNPEYVRKNVVEPVYLSEEHRDALEKIAMNYNTSIGTVFLEAMLEYTVLQAELLGLS